MRKTVFLFALILLTAVLRGQERDTLLYVNHKNTELNKALIYYTGNIDSLIASISHQVNADPKVEVTGKGVRYRYLESHLPKPIFERIYFDIVVSKFNTAASEDAQIVYVTFTSASGSNLTELMFDFAEDELFELFTKAIDYGFTGASGG
ncbi:MAG: hypothetical protein EP346_02920 [Bacteroidetes bacterium]|nr:MAG: hypothetical protein EP346_02920 [Bacteroidota bacterium]